MNKVLKLVAILGLAASITTGCSVNRATGNVDSSTNMSALKTMYVKKPKGDDGGTGDLIADKLRTKGVNVTTGREDKPMNVDAVVTYTDKWMWDITMYMLELTVVMRDPESEFPKAKGNSFHTSLTRKSPSEMVSEVIDNIYKAAQ